MANIPDVSKVAKAANSANNVAKAADTASKASSTISKVQDAKSTLDTARQNVEAINSVRRDGNEFMDGQVAEGYDVGENVAPGRVVGKDGTVQKSDTNEVIGAAATVVPIVLSGGFSSIAKEGGKKVAGETAKEIAKEGGKEAGKTAIKGAGKAAGQAAAKATGREAEKAARRAAAKGALNNFAKVGEKGLMDMAGDVVNSTQITKDVIGKGSELIGKASGGIADTIDKIPGVKLVEKAGLGDTARAVNATADAFGNLLNFDFGDMLSNLWKALVNLFKGVFKASFAYIAFWVILSIIGIMILFLPLWFILLDDLFYDETTERISAIETTYSSDAYSSMYGAGLYMTEAVKAVIDDVPDFDSLSNGRKVMVVAAATAIGTPALGNKPTDPSSGGVAGGISPGGLLEWAVWNITGSDPGEIDVSKLGSNSNFVSISQESLKPGDIGTDGLTVGIYMGNNKWVYLDTGSGVLRGNYFGFTSFYSVKDIDTIDVSAGDGGGGGIYYDGEGPSGNFRERVLFYANKLMEMKIPYNNIGKPYNGGYSLDINDQGFGTVVPGRTIDYENENKNNLDGLDCCGYAGYVYYLAANGKNNSQWMCSYTMGDSGYRDIPNFKQIRPEDAQPGDLIVKFNGHVMLFDYWGSDGSLHVYNSNMNDKTHTTYEVNGRTIKYNGTIIKQTYPKNGVYFFTYVGDEGNA